MPIAVVVVHLLDGEWSTTSEKPDSVEQATERPRYEYEIII